MAASSESLAESAIRALRQRHGIVSGINLIPPAVQVSFRDALRVAADALIESVQREISRSNGERREMILSVLASEDVVEQISNLLDPGLEIFDEYKVVDLLAAALPSETPDRAAVCRRAWDQFLKAFSFASRSMSELREFLRASYEASAFRKLTDVAGALDALENNLTELNRQERLLLEEMTAFGRDLVEYRQWAQDRL